MTRRMASRLGLIGTSPTIALKMEADKLEREGRRVVDFGPGEPDLPTPEPAKRAAIAAIEENFTHYTAAAGIHELRVEIARHYGALSGASIAPEEVLTGVGGKSVLFAAMLSLVNPGDDVCLVAPYWVSFPEQVRLAGGNIVLAKTVPEDGFTIRAEAIEAALTPATSMVIVNSPCNPSGGVLPRAEAEALARLAVQHDLWLVSDETYEALVYDPADRVSMLMFRDILGERLLFVSAFSKTWAMTGWRIGYGIGAKSVIKAMLTIQSHDTTHPASISQRAGLAALREAADAPQHMLTVYRGRRDRIVAGLNRIPGITCPVPRGAFYAYADVRELAAMKGLPSSFELSRQLLAIEAVATVPGEAFGMGGYLRFSYATSDEEIDEGLARLDRFARAR
ncbi:MAG: pyridoxal phosphate-dependent aminotransferase [Acidobacteria bacterium]|nr:pyridoxal phosphate-dependent aminotransferase [Acidobacteriota bacterium]